MSLWKLASLFLCFIVPSKIILTRNKTVEHHWAEKETFSNPDNLVQIIVSDLSPGVEVIMVTAIIAILIISNNIRKCFFLCLGKMSIVNLQASILTWFLYIIIPYTVLTRHLHQFNLLPIGQYSPSLFPRWEQRTLQLAFTELHSQYLSFFSFFFTSRRKIKKKKKKKSVLWSMQGLKVVWRDMFWINSVFVKPKSIRISSRKLKEIITFI